MPAATATSQSVRTRLDAPQIGEGLWNIYAAQGCCLVQFSTAQGDGNGFRMVTAAAGNGARFTVQGADPNINLILAGQGAGVVVIDSPLEVTGPVTLDSSLHGKGPVTLDSTLDVTGATTLHSTLTVAGATTLQSSLTQVTGTASFDSPTLVVEETVHKVGVGLVPTTGSAKLDVTGGFLRAADGPLVPPSAGTGVELTCSAGVGYLQAYNHGAAAYVELNLNANPLKLNTSSTAPITLGGATTANTTLHVLGVVTADSGLAVTGNISLTGVLVFYAATSQIIPGTSSFIITNNAQTQYNLTLYNAGTAAFWGPIVSGGASAPPGSGPGGVILGAGDLTLFNPQLKRGADTWLLPTGLGADTLVTLTAPQVLTQKTLGAGTKIVLGSDATGDLYYNAGAGTLARLAAGATTTVLLGGGAGAAPAWGAVDRTRVLLTLPNGIMTLQDAQTATGVKIFQGQIVCGAVSGGVGGHQLICASSAPGGATFSSAQIGLYDNTQPTLILRQMTNSVEAILLATSTTVVLGALTPHGLEFRTTNSARLTIATTGGVEALFGLGVTGGLTVRTNGMTLNGEFSWNSMTATAPAGTATNIQVGNTAGAGRPGAPTTVAFWLKLTINSSTGYLPWFQ